MLTMEDTPQSKNPAAPETPSTISVAGAAPAIAPDRESDQLKITLG